MISVNFRDARPIYEQIKDDFKKLIISGALSKDDKMPSVRTLATQLSINPNTIQRAYNELETEGFIYSVPGKGSFICSDSEKQKEHVEELKEQLRNIIKELRVFDVDEEDLMELLKEGRE